MLTATSLIKNSSRVLPYPITRNMELSIHPLLHYDVLKILRDIDYKREGLAF